LRSSLTFVKPGVRIERRSGQAQDDHLRMEEVARSGSILEGNCQLDLEGLSTEEQRETAIALVLASTRLIERLGGKRRRGTGKCKCTLDVPNAQLDEAVKWLAAR